MQLRRNRLIRELHVHGDGTLGSTAEAIGTLPDAPRAPAASSGTLNHTMFRVGTSEPIAVTLLKELLGPSVAVATLAASAAALHSPRALSLAFLALALVVFVLSQRMLSAPELRTNERGEYVLLPGVPKLLLEWAAVCAPTVFVISALHLTAFIGTDVLTIWIIVTPLVLIASNVGAIRLARWLSAHASEACRHIIIGATPAGLELAKRVQLGSCGRFLGFFDFRDPGRLPPLSPELWCGPARGVAEFVRRNGVGAIYIALPISTTPRLATLLQELRDTTASVYLVPANIFDFDLVQPRCLAIQGIPALAVCESPHLGVSGLGKRAMDLALGIGALLVSGPLMLAIAAAIKLSSRGPVLFRQHRYGLNGERILVYKFRTMTVCEDGAEVRQATRNDCRTTRIGRLLRRTSLDELPQIFNVLEGRMSFVGPRPHAVAHNELYRKLISGYMIRHKVRPGITGWAQVNGLRGETDTLPKMRQRVECDVYYLNHWSLWLDVKILLRTLPLLIRDRHAY